MFAKKGELEPEKKSPPLWQKCEVNLPDILSSGSKKSGCDFKWPAERRGGDHYIISSSGDLRKKGFACPFASKHRL